jgi:serine/threonine-protein kinase HipA
LPRHFCRLLGLGCPKQAFAKIAALSKYEAEGGPSLKTCCNAILARSSQPALDKKRLIEWVIFNVLAGNMDGHAKNLSLTTQGNQTELAPFYDLVCTVVYPNLSQKLAFKIGGENRPKWLMVRHWQRFAEDVSVKPQFIDKVITDMTREIEMVLPKVVAELKELVSSSQELQILDKVESQVAMSVGLMKSRLES